MKILTPNKNKETEKAIHTNIKKKKPIQLGSTVLLQVQCNKHVLWR